MLNNISLIMGSVGRSRSPVTEKNPTELIESESHIPVKSVVLTIITNKVPLIIYHGTGPHISQQPGHRYHYGSVWRHEEAHTIIVQHVICIPENTIGCFGHVRLHVLVCLWPSCWGSSCSVHVGLLSESLLKAWHFKSVVDYCVDRSWTCPVFLATDKWLP